MASDLSELIQNGLSQTLESLLAKASKLDHINKTHETDLRGNCVEVTSKFNFDQLESTWKFYIPALSATYILNLMMGEEDSPPSEEVDEDTLDALNEVVSNICGGLSTAINASGFDDLGGVQFSLAGNEIADGEAHSTDPNLYKFVILLEEKEVVFFIAFDEVIMPYIESISKSEETKVEEIDDIDEIDEEYPEEEVLEEKSEEEKSEEEIEEEYPEEEEDETEEEIENISKEEEKDKEPDGEESEEEKPSKLAFLKKLNFLKVDENLSDEAKKEAKLKKIIILVGGLFGIVILIGVILYFTGAFEPEEIEEVVDSNTTEVIKEKVVSIKIKPIKKYIKFKPTQINVKRLNKKLSLLTKYEILEGDEIERLKAIEKEKMYKQRQKKLELFARNNKEEQIFKKIIKDTDIVHQNEFMVDGIVVDKNQTTITKDKIIALESYIQIPTIKLRKFQKFIKDSKKITANLSICKDNNGRTQIFIGPYLDTASRATIIKTVSKELKKHIILLDLSKNQIEKMCKI